jgi:acyl-coenzyme A synthetase/AMP-(fatty) acid ligase
MPSSSSDSTGYGKRLLPCVVDERAAQGHPRPYASIPRTADINDGYRDISYETFASAINRCAEWLRARFGEPEVEETIAYAGPSDLRYNILALAAVKSGYVVSTRYDKSYPDSTETMTDVLPVSSEHG